METITTLVILFLFGKEHNLCENLYWDSRYNSDEIVLDICTENWQEVYNFNK